VPSKQEEFDSYYNQECNKVKWFEPYVQPKILDEWNSQSIKPGMHLLDVGSGFSLDPIFFAVNNVQVTALDFSENALAKLKELATLYGVKIEISISETNTLRCASTEDGSFEIKNVPIGKYDLSASLALYESKTVTIEVNSGKEMIVNIPLLERVSQKEEVKVVGRKKGEVINEMALISAQQFSVEETNRYPGSRMDPARMASNFAGVQGSDDSRNDIVVRGNSPLGVIYRVENVEAYAIRHIKKGKYIGLLVTKQTTNDGN
jgi:precorrin-6B methylase 2